VIEVLKKSLHFYFLVFGEISSMENNAGGG